MTAAAEHDRAGAPFVSVLVLVRDGTPSTLVEALLSLASQTDPDFEVLLVSANDAALDAAHELASELPPAFVQRVHRVTAASSDTAVLVPAGIEAARGTYVVVTAETDTLFADWVAHVKRLGLETPGCIVRGTVLEQEIEIVTVRGQAAVRATSAPTFLPGPGRGLGQHLETGRIPVLGVAFPKELAGNADLGLDPSRGDAALPLFLWAATGAREVVDVDHVVGFERTTSAVTDTAVVIEALTAWVDSGSFALPAGSSRALLADRAEVRRTEKAVRGLKREMQLKDDHIDNIEAMLNSERRHVDVLQHDLQKRDARIADLKRRLSKARARAASGAPDGPQKGTTRDTPPPKGRGLLGGLRRRSSD